MNHRPLLLSPAAQQAYDQALLSVTSLPTHLFTPQAWAELAVKESFDLLGTPEGAAKLAEAKRYLACAELAQRLLARITELEATIRPPAA